MNEFMKLDMEFYRGKKVLITGHTGFKGSWMCKVLVMLGAEVIGYALNPPTNPSLFEMCGIEKHMESIIGDVRDLEHLKCVFSEKKPEIVFHMAAQPIVRESYENPVYTYDVNVMGTVNLLECVRQTDSVKSVLNITTDKVYLNRDKDECFKETDELNGADPYSNSKSCSELVTSSYVQSFFQNRDVRVSTARAGNVIGGGDFAVDRIIPDCYRATAQKLPINIRNPHAVRPFQHVLEPIFVYLMIAKKQYENRKFSDCYNVGPDIEDCYSVGELVDLWCDSWKYYTGIRPVWERIENRGPNEKNFLKLDCAKLKKIFDWDPVWTTGMAIEKTVEWYATYLSGDNVAVCMEKQIGEFYEIKSMVNRQ